jgi:TonB family protein
MPFRTVFGKGLVGVMAWWLTAPAIARGQTPVELVLQGGVRAAWHDDVLHLDSGPGQVRTRRLYSDCVVEFELRLLELRTRARFAFRSWPGYDADGSPEYEVSFSESPNGVPSSNITARHLTFNPVAVDRPAPATESRAAGDWHKVRIVIERAKAAVYVDGQLMAAADRFNEFTGYLTLSSADGAAEFRRIGVGILTAANESFGEGAHHLSEPGLQPPRLIREVKPFYPRDAHDRRTIEAVILEDGSPGEIRVLKSVEPDLDEAAIAAARKWRFRPAMKDGSPVRVVVTIELSFTLDQGPR